MSTLRINEVNLHNYKQFEKQKIVLDPTLTVIHGKGDTTLLDGVVSVLRNIQYRMKQASGLCATLEWDDITAKANRAMVTPVISFNDNPTKFTICSIKRGGNRNFEVRRQNFLYTNLCTLCAEIITDFKKSARIPVMSYFYNKVKPVKNYYRTAGEVDINNIRTYVESLTKYESKTQFFLFMGCLARHTRSAHDKKDCPKCKLYFQMCEYMEEILPFIKKFRIGSSKTDQALVLSSGIEANYDMLSNKEFSTLHFVGDLLYRIFIANSCRIDNEAYGVVCVDDVDVVLTDINIIYDLQERFPLLQFVVATKWPQLFEGKHIVDSSIINEPEYYYGDNLYKDSDKEVIW
jgi:predicted ATP-binding protein involved in virulence